MHRVFLCDWRFNTVAVFTKLLKLGEYFSYLLFFFFAVVIILCQPETCLGLQLFQLAHIVLELVQCVYRF